jgi:hypothetical protein
MKIRQNYVEIGRMKYFNIDNDLDNNFGKLNKHQSYQTCYKKIVIGSHDSNLLCLFKNLINIVCAAI